MFGYSDPNMALYKLSLCTHGSCKISHSKGPMWNHFFECSKYGAQFWPRHNFSAVSKSSQRMSCWLSIKSSGTCKKTHDSTGKLAFAIGDDEQHVAINNFEKKKHQLHQCSFFMLPVFQLISISSWPHLVTPPNKTQGPWFLIDSHTWKPGTRPFHHPQSSTDFTVLVALRSQLKSKAAAPATWMSQPNNLTQWGAILGHLRYPKTQ